MNSESSNRIDLAFERGKALICYVPLGDPFFPVDLLDIYVECGVDVIEVGLPNIDPYMDGPLIADSMARVREARLTTADIHRQTMDIRRRYPELAILWMCYEDADLGDFDSQSAECDLDGLLMVGFEKRTDQQDLLRTMKKNNVHNIRFAGFEKHGLDTDFAKLYQGYVFLQALDGVTGARSDDLSPTLARKISRLREFGVTIPIAIGFGINSPDQVRQALGMGANGIITGSGCVEAAFAGAPQLREYLASLRTVLDGDQVENPNDLVPSAPEG